MIAKKIAAIHQDFASPIEGFPSGFILVFYLLLNAENHQVANSAD